MGNGTYKVVDGDTLWSIAKTQLGSCRRYVDIVKLNKLKTSTLVAGTVLAMPVV